jgi:predicted phosphoribosyltransferase
VQSERRRRSLPGCAKSGSARALEEPLHVIVVRKLCAPGDPEVGLGAPAPPHATPSVAAR